MATLEFFAVNHLTGAALGGAEVWVFNAGTQNPTTLSDLAGASLSNPFYARADGLVAFQAALGTYDIQVQLGGYTAPLIQGQLLFSLADIAGAGFAVSVQQFNARGDGVTDDTAALQAAIHAVSAAVVSSNVQGGGVVRIPRGWMLRTTSPLYLEKGVVLQGEMGVGAFFADFTPGQITGSGIFADFDFSAGGAIEAVGFVAATGQRISPSTYIKGADVDAGTYTHHSGTGLRDLFIYTDHATAFCPVRFVGAPQWTLDNVYIHGFWHGPIANASWVGSVPRLFSRSLYSGLIVDQDCNGCSFGSLYLSGDLAGAVSGQVPAGRQFPNWDPYGISPADPNTQPANANMLRTGLVVMSGDPAAAEVVICENWNVGVVCHASALRIGSLEAETISGWVATVYASRFVVDNLFAYVPGKSLIYSCVGADIRIGVPEEFGTSSYFTSPVQFYSTYTNNFEYEGTRQPYFPFLGSQVVYRQAEDSPYNDVYLDVSAGSDSVVGCAAAAPLQTFLEALFRLRTDKINRIFLQQGQTVQTIIPGAMFHDNGAVLEDLLIDNMTLELRSYQPASGAAARPILAAPPDGSNVHTNGLILRNSKVLFQDVDYQVRMCTGTPEGYNAGLYIRGLCDVRFVGASTVQIESGANVQLGLFQPWYGSAGMLTWDVEDAASVVQYPGSAAAAALGVSAYQGQGRLSVVGGYSSSANPAIDATIHANGFVGPSYPAGAVNQA